MYKLANNCVIRLDDGALIPFDPDNCAYQAYLAWKADGGVPLPADTPPLADQQEATWEKIKSERLRREGGGVLVGSYWFHTDLVSRVKWLGLKDQARDVLASGGTMSSVLQKKGRDVLWKTLPPDAWVTVTVQLAFDVVAAVGDLDAGLYEAANDHKNAMLAAADPTAYDYLAGWPKIYGE